MLFYTPSAMAMPVYPTAFSRIARTVIMPWRLVAAATHLTGLLAVIDYRATMIAASLPPDPDAADLDLMRQSTNVGLALTFLAWLVCTFGFLSGRTSLSSLCNFMHACFHTIGGVFLIVVWNETQHAVRVWHVFFTCSMVPALLELLTILLQRLQGTYMW